MIQTMAMNAPVNETSRVTAMLKSIAQAVSNKVIKNDKT